MKISEFSNKCNLSRETIRYYTEEKLILPHKIKHYYDYDEQCLKDVGMILKLKKMTFSLIEIKEILNYYRLEPKAFPKLNELLLDYFEKKLQTLNLEKEEIFKKEMALKSEVTRLKRKIKESEQVVSNISGVDLSLLPLLFCKRCGINLKLKKATIKNNQIVSGILECGCGMKYDIHEGIIFCEGFDSNKKAPRVDSKEEVEERYPKEYNSVKTLGENWLKRKFEGDLRNGDLILDLTLMGGVFSQKILETNNLMDLTYIGCERWLDFIKVSKRAIESLENSPKTLFCCGDVECAPFKENIFDKVIDVYGTTTDMRETGAYKIKEKLSLLKEKGKYYGTYVDIRDLSHENPRNLIKSFDFEEIKTHLESLKQKELMVSHKTTELGELNKIIKKSGLEELCVYSISGEKTRKE